MFQNGMVVCVVHLDRAPSALNTILSINIRSFKMNTYSICIGAKYAYRLHRYPCCRRPPRALPQPARASSRGRRLPPPPLHGQRPPVPPPPRRGGGRPHRSARPRRWMCGGSVVGGSDAGQRAGRAVGDGLGAGHGMAGFLDAAFFKRPPSHEKIPVAVVVFSV